MSLLSRLLFKPETVFREALDNVDAISARMTDEMKDGVALFGSALLDDLNKRGVLNRTSHNSLLRELKEWHRKKKK